MSRAVQTDVDGYLVNKDDWSTELANQIAERFGLELGAAHWKVLETARAIEAEYGFSPGLRKISRRSAMPIREIYRLFPDGPAKLIAKIAGLPKPKSCL